ncbi:MAG TPA: HK97 family phage prohead protease [Gaiellales bacterium]|jgi:hypothetical protein|nr:HK97 family phage prohead protease [Gaiellales bacterium]
MTEATKLLRRTFQAPLEAKDGRILEGCIVPYGEATKVSDGGPAYFELFEPGCFRKQLRAADKLELRYEHRDDLGSSVGVGRALHEEASGLYGEFTVHQGAFGDQALELVRSGVLPGFSVEFRDRFAQWRKVGETVVRSSCELFSVGLVRKPAYQGALVTAMRSRQEWADLLDLPGQTAEAELARLRAVGISV